MSRRKQSHPKSRKFLVNENVRADFDEDLVSLRCHGCIFVLFERDERISYHLHTREMRKSESWTIFIYSNN